MIDDEDNIEVDNVVTQPIQQPKLLDQDKINLIKNQIKSSSASKPSSNSNNKNTNNTPKKSEPMNKDKSISIVNKIKDDIKRKGMSPNKNSNTTQNVKQLSDIKNKNRSMPIKKEVKNNLI